MEANGRNWANQLKVQMQSFKSELEKMTNINNQDEVDIGQKLIQKYDELAGNIAFFMDTALENLGE